MQSDKIKMAREKKRERTYIYIYLYIFGAHERKNYSIFLHSDHIFLQFSFSIFFLTSLRLMYDIFKNVTLAQARAVLIFEAGVCLLLHMPSFILVVSFSFLFPFSPLPLFALFPTYSYIPLQGQAWL